MPRGTWAAGWTERWSTRAHTAPSSCRSGQTSGWQSSPPSQSQGENNQICGDVWWRRQSLIKTNVGRGLTTGLGNLFCCYYLFGVENFHHWIHLWVKKQHTWSCCCLLLFLNLLKSTVCFFGLWHRVSGCIWDVFKRLWLTYLMSVFTFTILL